MCEAGQVYKCARCMCGMNSYHAFRHHVAFSAGRLSTDDLELGVGKRAQQQRAFPRVASHYQGQEQAEVEKADPDPLQSRISCSSYARTLLPKHSLPCHLAFGFGLYFVLLLSSSSSSGHLGS